MGRDASLDEFLAGESAAEPAEGEPDADGSAADGDPGERPAAADDPAVEPATPTYDWTPGGAECARCDATVERRWRDDGGLVCEDCKEW